MSDLYPAVCMYANVGCKYLVHLWSGSPVVGIQVAIAATLSDTIILTLPKSIYCAFHLMDCAESEGSMICESLLLSQPPGHHGGCYRDLYLAGSGS